MIRYFHHAAFILFLTVSSSVAAQDAATIPPYDGNMGTITDDTFTQSPDHDIPTYDEAQTEPWMATPTCETYPEWMGQHIDTINLSILGNRPHRILKPGSMATMDYLPDRLNIHTTEDGIIVTQDCG